MNDFEEICNEMENDAEEDDENIDQYIVPDDEVDVFSRVNIDNVSEKDKEFVKNIHDYYDNWTNWK